MALEIQVVVLERKISGEKWDTMIMSCSRANKSTKVNFPSNLS